MRRRKRIVIESHEKTSKTTKIWTRDRDAKTMPANHKRARCFEVGARNTVPGTCMSALKRAKDFRLGGKVKNRTLRLRLITNLAKVISYGF